MNDFGTYTVWYILLAVLAACQLAFALALAEDRRPALALYLALAGIVLSFETVILIIFKAYAYYPMLLQTCPEPFDRILAGNLFSQFTVAATALLVAVRGLQLRWQLVLALAYGLIEELFLFLGVYAHNWYRTWMTVLGLLVYFQLARTLLAYMRRGLKPPLYYACVALGLFPLYVVTVMWGFMVSGHLGFSRTVLADPVASIYFLCLAVFSIPAAAVMMLIRYRPLAGVRAALAVLALFLFYLACARLGLIIIKEGWFFVVTAVTAVWMYLSVLLMDWLCAPARK
jgi:hypothetical protein